MASYVLIHGAWHGAWAWDHVRPILEAAGHRVVAPDLPGLGDDTTPLPQVTLKAYADVVAAAIAAAGEPVVLVGHSMGGLAITQAAELDPRGIARLVYVCAFMIRDGETLLQHALNDPGTDVPRFFRFSDDQSIVTVDPDGVVPCFYADCPPEVAERARPRLRPQALGPFMAPLSAAAGRWKQVPRTYIECTQDRAISLAKQREMHGAEPPEQVITMETGHSPFFSAPEALAQHLLALA